MVITKQNQQPTRGGEEYSGNHWEDWADDVADIADAQTARIRSLLGDSDAVLRKGFEAFVEGLRGNLNDSITEEEAIGMLSQNLITAPVFNALFAEYDFAAHNPVSRVMQRMVDALADKRLESETEGFGFSPPEITSPNKPERISTENTPTK